MRRGLGVLCGLTAAMALIGVASADGVLPPLPYRYLHPPASLASENKHPLSGTRQLPLDYARAVTWFAFTQDQQAGMSVPRGGVAVDPQTKSIVANLTPAEIPSGLPPQVGPDGNAYTITVTQQPGGKPARPRRPFHVILRWPHIPLGIYTYRNGSWHRLCYENKAILTSNTISCTASQFGLFLAVTQPSPSPSNPPSTPVPGLSRYLPLIIVILILIGAIVAGYLVSRPDRSEDAS